MTPTEGSFWRRIADGAIYQVDTARLDKSTATGAARTFVKGTTDDREADDR